MAVTCHEGWARPAPSRKAAHQLRSLGSAPEAPPREPRDPAFAAGVSALTRMQRVVVRCRCRGLSGAATARQYGLSPQTVKNHLTAAYRVLGITGTSRGARACYLLGRYDGDFDDGTGGA